MQHGKKTRTLGRDTDQRTALLRSLAVALFTHGSIQTTLAKAKELRPFVERLVTLARTNTVSARRIVTARMGGNEAAVAVLFTQVAPHYVDRQGGYTRITKLGIRSSDAAPLAQIEFVK
jgi:ribosomal protein L17